MQHPAKKAFNWLVEEKLLRKVGTWYEFHGRPLKDEVEKFAHAMLTLGIWSTHTRSGHLHVEYRSGAYGTQEGMRVRLNLKKGGING